MQANVIFDKEIYFSGDIVRAKFLLQGPYHKNSRKIFLGLKSGENVAITYTTGSGKTRSTHTIWAKHVYNESIKELEIPIDDNPINFKLDMQLPEFLTENMKAYNFRVYHEATVKLDISRRSDEKFLFAIPIFVDPPSNDRIMSQDLTSSNFTMNVSHDRACVGDVIEVGVTQLKDIKYRSIRVELHQKVHRWVRKRSASIKEKKVLTTIEPQQYFTQKITLPYMNYSSLKGNNYRIETTLKIIIDKSMAKDENYEFIIEYYNRARRENRKSNHHSTSKTVCPFCGFDNNLNAKFCEECGEQIK